MKSILQNDKCCFFCGTAENLHRHHVFGGSANRQKSEKWGCTVWLCGAHHNLSSKSVHHDHQMDLILKKYAQRVFEEKYGHETFMKEFHKNYL